MGMYTELYLSCGLKRDIPDEVLKILKYLFDPKCSELVSSFPDHMFFKCARWEAIGRSSSYYFVPMPTSNLYFDGRDRYLTTRSDLKNYSGEISNFLDWIMPYIDACEGDHLGHYRYEEDAAPTLIIYPNAKL